VHKGCIVCILDEGADCDSTSSIVSGVKTMCELIICPKSKTKKFHKLGCIKGDYNKCGAFQSYNFVLGRWIPTMRCSYLGRGLRMFMWGILMMEVTNMQYGSNAN
jgi:hypothetical protein